MRESRGAPRGRRPDTPPFDVSVAHPARIYDYWLGGKDNFAVDRAAGDQIIELRPEIVHAVRSNRRFLHRSVRYLDSTSPLTCTPRPGPFGTRSAH